MMSRRRKPALFNYTAAPARAATPEDTQCPIC